MMQNKRDETTGMAVCRAIIDNEYSSMKANGQSVANDYKRSLQLLDPERGDREYEWMSDVRLPEFVSLFLTQCSLDTSAYFTKRDFVTAYVEDSDPGAALAADAATELINRTLNQRHLHYFLKYIRARQISTLHGPVYAECWWEKGTRTELVGFDVEKDEETGETPSVSPVYEDVLAYDRFNFDVLDPRNIYLSNEYTYSVQEKQVIITVASKTVTEIMAEAEEAGYTNLEGLQNMTTRKYGDTDAGDNIKSEREPKTDSETDMPGFVDVIKRYGKFWAVVTEVDPVYFFPTAAEPGIDAHGQKLEKAVAIECIAVFAKSGSQSVLLAFMPTPYIDSTGKPFRPIIRGMCYPHPGDDGGFGDGKHAADLQNAIDDTINISNDRVRLATMPVMKVRKYANEDNVTLRIEPGNAIELEDPANDLFEMKISDDIAGALQQVSLLRNSLQTLTNIYPNTMGNLAGTAASTSATAIAGAERRSDQRTNFKSNVFEYTFLTDLYWMIQQMTYQFAERQTIMRLMGDKSYNFAPGRDYWYKAVSDAIESEYAKETKIRAWTELLKTVAPMAQVLPDAQITINYVMAQIAGLLGDEFAQFKEMLFHGQPVMDGKGSGTPPGGQATVPMSNQNAIPQSGLEQGVRGAAQ